MRNSGPNHNCTVGSYCNRPARRNLKWRFTFATRTTQTSAQPCVLALRLGENGNIGIGVVPEREEVLIRRLCPGRVALHGVSAGHAEMGERSNGLVLNNASPLEDLFKLG